MDPCSRLFRYSGRDYTVRRAEPHFVAAINILSDEMAKEYRSNSNYFYSCLNQRGLRSVAYFIFILYDKSEFREDSRSDKVPMKSIRTKQYFSIVQTGNPVSKNTQNPGTLRGIKQYISTYLFDKPQMREQIPIEKPVNSNHMIQIRSPLQVKGRDPRTRTGRSQDRIRTN